MLMKAAVGQGSFSSPILVSPPPFPFLLPLPSVPFSDRGADKANLSSGDIKNPCEVSCCNFCASKPHDLFLIPLFLTCSLFFFYFPFHINYFLLVFSTSALIQLTIGKVFKLSHFFLLRGRFSFKLFPCVDFPLCCTGLFKTLLLA